ncbi:HpcH/HpaI aldolase/citrate lyase family protein [Microlunatus speluncae]|uniref:HpcH/HpaI aldolase/citrate lyase family protein n=1 Tax=Microlunatus speluncae TaxID=2594267 RepID=UPI0012661382|nr:CoA ester lyase [Microlunatus speluncae]
MIVTALYVPGDRPERFAKAVGSGADQVIIDLEDAVAPDRKDYARDAVREFLAGPAVETPIAVRPNGAGTRWHDQDLIMLAASPALAALRLPKVERIDELDRIAASFADRDQPVSITALIETGFAVEHAYRIAGHRAVTGIALGELDLRAELGLSTESGLDWIRVRVVVAARAAGLPAPQQAVYPDVADLAGLADSCRAGAALGFCGRTAIHPRQLPVIRKAYAPAPDAVDQARAVLAALGGGVGVAVLPDGRMIDEAVAVEARRVLELAALTAT